VQIPARLPYPDQRSFAHVKRPDDSHRVDSVSIAAREEGQAEATISARVEGIDS
jgi:hypothetical protein